MSDEGEEDGEEKAEDWQRKRRVKRHGCQAVVVRKL